MIRRYRQPQNRQAIPQKQSRNIAVLMKMLPFFGVESQTHPKPPNTIAEIA